MIVSIVIIVFNDDGTIMLKSAAEENVPRMVHDPSLAGAAALMRERELLGETQARLERQAESIGITGT